MAIAALKWFWSGSNRSDAKKQGGVILKGCIISRYIIILSPLLLKLLPSCLLSRLGGIGLRPPDCSHEENKTVTDPSSHRHCCLDCCRGCCLKATSIILSPLLLKLLPSCLLSRLGGIGLRRPDCSHENKTVTDPSSHRDCCLDCCRGCCLKATSGRLSRIFFSRISPHLTAAELCGGYMREKLERQDRRDSSTGNLMDCPWAPTHLSRIFFLARVSAYYSAAEFCGGICVTN